jgi:hypothetical protein
MSNEFMARFKMIYSKIKNLKSVKSKIQDCIQMIDQGDLVGLENYLKDNPQLTIEVFHDASLGYTTLLECAVNDWDDGAVDKILKVMDSYTDTKKALELPNRKKDSLIHHVSVLIDEENQKLSANFKNQNDLNSLKNIFKSLSDYDARLREGEEWSSQYSNFDINLKLFNEACVQKRDLNDKLASKVETVPVNAPPPPQNPVPPPAPPVNKRKV